MSSNLSSVILFPEDFPPVTTGVLLLEQNFLITGHENGFVVKWELETGSHEILFESDSKVTTISYSGEHKIAVGYHSGGLYLIELETKRVVILRKPKYNIESRVWRTNWPTPGNLLLTSTYGELTTFSEINGVWEENFMALKGHDNSIFAINSINGKYVATGDYTGNILLWGFKDGNYTNFQKIGISGTIEDITWYSEQCFAVITESGKICLMERENQNSQSWQTVLEVDIAKNKGVCLTITDDGKTIFACTAGELIQIDLDSYQTETKKIQYLKRIFSNENAILILTDKGLFNLQKHPITIKEELIKYRFMKISLLGHTGTGKTTFCNRLLYDDVNDIYSTFGKRIFNWKFTDSAETKKRLIFHDHGGQETVLDTFIPFILDSDIILIFYKQTDKTTFNKSLKILKQIREKVSATIPVYFVQTFVDHELDEIPYKLLEHILENKEIIDVVKLSPTDNIGFEDFQAKIVDKINWNRTRIMIQSPYIFGISKTLLQLHDDKVPVILFDVFKEKYQKIIKNKISVRHLNFLLKDFTNQGVIEYYPDISDLIILDDKAFNKMRTDIPIMADHKEGILNFNDLKKQFENEFLAILDEMYIQSGIAVKNGNLRIFPHKLRDKSLNMPEKYLSDLEQQEISKIFVKYQELNRTQLISLLSDLQLQCIKLSKNEGLFAWENFAYIYYIIQEERRGMFEKYIRFDYVVGGQKQKTKERLVREFFSAIKRIYGPTLDIEENSDKKKVQPEYEFDVALSFAGEQRDYVEKVAIILKRKGLDVFYDKFKQSHLWGKNLVEYFQKVYYSKSKFCIMFISRDYLRKMWPVHERKNATARDLEQFGEYILPVIFERVNVPGLDKHRGYLNAKKLTPEMIAQSFLEKFENN